MTLNHTQRCVLNDPLKTVKGTIKTLTLTLALAVLLPAMAFAGEAPIKEIPSAHYGSHVNKTTGANTCTVISHNECQPAIPGSEPGGFEYPEGVVSTPNGNLYVVDRGNHRVQELTASGVFVSMFGWDVNKTKTASNAPQSERDYCTAASHDTCQAGVEGTEPGQFSEEQASMTVDPASENVYVAEVVTSRAGGELTFGERVQELTSEGAFVLEIGKEVNGTTHGNVCTAVEAGKGVKCTSPTKTVVGSEPGAFSFAEQHGDLLAVGGPEGLLYVGDEHRVQEFHADTGLPAGEIPLGSVSSVPGVTVQALAVDKTGDVFLTYGAGSSLVRKFDPTGKEVANVDSSAGSVYAMALDPSGRLAVAASSGALFDASTLRLITHFPDLGSGGTAGIAFNDKPEAKGFYELYSTESQEVVAYSPVAVAELLSTPSSCSPGVEHETDVTLVCSLSGEINPWGVSQTVAWFQWSATSGLGSETSKQSVAEGSVPVKQSAEVQGVRPNETLYYRLVAEDANVQAPELLTGEILSLATPSVAPQIIGDPTASHVHASFAVLYGELNPENTNTNYHFEYGECPGGLEGCAQVSESNTPQSSAYGGIATTLEVDGLQPSTTYRYRLIAEHEHEPRVAGPEESFTTPAGPSPQAVTGAASVLGASTATITGTLDPDGEPATYAFELGVDRGSATQFGIVFSGQAGAGTTPVGRSLLLTGLQPGTTYAYRIKISSGYGTLTGQTDTFTTEGLPAVISTPTVLGMLALPAIAFPKPPVSGKAKSIKKKKQTKNKKKRKKARKSRKAAVKSGRRKAHAG